MRRIKQNKGMTLAELAVAMAVLAGVVAIFLVSTRSLKEKARMGLTENTITLLGTALEQYYDYWQDYPPDCNDLDSTVDLKNILDANSLDIWTKVNAGDPLGPEPDANELQKYTGIGIAYYCLNKTGTSKRIMSKLDESVISTLAEDESKMGLTIDNVDFPFYYVLDAWKTPLRYSRTWVDPTGGSMTDRLKGFTKDFPKIESAGPDKEFDTEDDITSKEN